eukprot:2367928-Rhodomonas_salina.2
MARLRRPLAPLVPPHPISVPDRSTRIRDHTRSQYQTRPDLSTSTGPYPISVPIPDHTRSQCTGHRIGGAYTGRRVYRGVAGRSGRHRGFGGPVGLVLVAHATSEPGSVWPGSMGCKQRRARRSALDSTMRSEGAAQGIAEPV